jgi:hypothetical protein
MRRKQTVFAAAVAFVAAAGAPRSACADINLELRPMAQTALEGRVVRVGLYAVSDDPEMDQKFLAADVILNWDPSKLRLLGVHNDGPYTWLFSGFPVGDVDGLNDTFEDGDALYTALGQLGQYAWATPSGLLMTTLLFRTLEETDGTVLSMAEDAGTYTHTSIWGSPGYDVVGVLGTATVEIVTCDAVAFDDDADGDVDLSDFAVLQVCFTGAGGVATIDCQCVFDTNADQDVDVSDYAGFAEVMTGPSP